MLEGKYNLSDKISLRPVNLEEDEKFLKKLYFSTREEDFAAWAAMSKEQAENLLEMQFTAQKMQYALDFPNAEHSIILLEGKTVGRLLTNQTEQEIHVVDIAILSEYRGHGIGSVVLKNLLEKALRTGRNFKLQVVKTNPAINLYLRLGLEIVGESVLQYQMERRPSK